MARRVLCAVAVAAVLCGHGSTSPALSDARVGLYRLVIIPVRYSDLAAFANSQPQLNNAIPEIESYFRGLSYDKLHMQVIVVASVYLDHPFGYYWYRPDCVADGCYPPTNLGQEVIKTAARDGVDFVGVDGVSVLSPCAPAPPAPVALPSPAPPYPRAGDITVLSRISTPEVSAGPFQQSYDFDCLGDPHRTPPGGLPPPRGGGSGVWWGAWAHQFGHQLQSDAGYPYWSGHPGAYGSGYDFMDSCGPCDQSAYGLSGEPLVGGDQKDFPDWLEPGRVEIVQAPAGSRAPATQTHLAIAPISLPPSVARATQAIKIPIADGIYYFVQARTRSGADAIANGFGIWDEGVQITYIDERADPPQHERAPCEREPHGCVRQEDSGKAAYDPRTPTCHPEWSGGTRSVATVPDYCWPYRLWQPGQTFSDNAESIHVRVNDTAGSGPARSYDVTVERGPQRPRAQLVLTPWLTPPMRTWATVDLWVDSSCNGYEADVGLSGLRYGRRADGTIIGVGDDLCANHENRVYAQIHNFGDVGSAPAMVLFYASDLSGVAIGSGAGWSEIGMATVGPVAPHSTATVYVDWTPRVALAEDQIRANRIALHASIRARVEPAPGDTFEGASAQASFADIEARIDPTTSKVLIPELSFSIHNDFFHETVARQFYLAAHAELPSDWTVEIDRGAALVDLAPSETKAIPVRIKVPGLATAGKSYLLQIDAHTLATLENPATSPRSPEHQHRVDETVGGVALQAHVVLQSKLTLAARPDRLTSGVGAIVAEGHLDKPHPGAIVAVDFSPPGGDATVTKLASVNRDGDYAVGFEPARPGTWSVRALWQGDLDHSSAVSDSVRVEVPAGESSAPTPPAAGASSAASPALYLKGSASPATVYYGPCGSSHPTSVTVQSTFTSALSLAVTVRYQYVSGNPKLPSSDMLAAAMTMQGPGVYTASIDVGLEAFAYLRGGSGTLQYQVSAVDRLRGSGVPGATGSVTVQYCQG